MKQSFVPFEKQSKKSQAETNKARRVAVAFNTGTRVHGDARHKSRAQEKDAFRKEKNF